LDKKLLLTIQSVCNSENVKIPWDKVAAIMGEHISDGAVIQHLAKLRQRMVAQKLEVPPPLRRGAGVIVSTAFSGGGSGRSKSAPSKTAKSTPKKGRSNTANDNDDEEVEYDVDEASDPEEEFRQARSKRSKRNTEVGRNTVIKTKGTDEDFDTPSRAGDKRKDKSSAFKAEKGKKNTAGKQKDKGLMADMIAAQTISGDRTKSIIDYNEEKEVSGNDYQDNSQSEDSGQEFDGVQHVASGASFLCFETDSDTGKVKQDLKTPSKIVVLPLPGPQQHTENHPDTPDYSVSLETGSGMTEDVVEPDIKSDAGSNHNVISGLPIINASFDEEALETAPGLTYNNNSGSGMFGLFGMDATADTNLIDASFFHHNVDPDYTLNQGLGSTDFTYPFGGQDWTAGSKNASASTSQYVDTGSGNYMYGNQERSILPETPLNAFSPSSIATQSFDTSGLRTSSFGIPGFGTSETASSYNFPVFEDNQGLGQYSTDNNKDIRFTPANPSFSAPPRPSVVTRQANQPSVSSEPFSATSSNNNPTPTVVPAGDANAMPALDFGGPFFGAELDDPLTNPMDLDALDREWDGAYEDHRNA